MEITSRKCLDGSKTKLGFDKSKVTCFRCKQKGHFKRDVNREVNKNDNPFHDDYYKKAIYHQNSEQSSKPAQQQIAEGPSKEKKQAMVTIHDDKGFNRDQKLTGSRTIHDDEGFNRSKYLKEDKRALFAEVKMKEEVFQEQTLRKRYLQITVKEMQKKYVEARRIGRWDKKRECYINHKGDQVVDSSKVIYNDVLAVIPLSGERSI
ncbi:putative transcription factor interactor and regulator CCHC(Zn) family [Helianthus debilis subsp. tardiflorus]